MTKPVEGVDVSHVPEDKSIGFAGEILYQTGQHEPVQVEVYASEPNPQNIHQANFKVGEEGVVIGDDDRVYFYQDVYDRICECGSDKYLDREEGEYYCPFHD